ncbi:hypothetical protein ILUMI_04771 [Ignelater luminosus]|uniref:J domain-containing protein n=1 Tax=Ignelater luminosus TaxID=2038154 RepID=A0A8K0D8C1_IGNLU|nr:hypothetical protein ILUMI_04771 [Ignelater luminosus]
MVKRFHPDSCTDEANVDKFQEIDKAFRVLMDKKSKERWDVDAIEEAEEQDIIHTAPQHRQYLSYGGVGFGNPFQRQKQYTKVRAMQASENVMKHRMAKTVADEKSLMAKTSLRHKIKTK